MGNNKPVNDLYLLIAFILAMFSAAFIGLYFVWDNSLFMLVAFIFASIGVYMGVAA
jgi:hypothetical protein